MVNQEEVYLAYLKLKHFIYRDNQALLLRSEIALFEQSALDKKISDLTRHINQYLHGEDGSAVNNLCSAISYWALPKSFEADQVESKFGLKPITNTNASDETKVKSHYFYINAPIEIHIISVIWLMRAGFLLQKKMRKSPHGYKLILNDDESGIVDGIRLFGFYVHEYKAWRDGATEAALEVVKKKDKNAFIIGLDIKNCFHSIDLSFEKMKKDLPIDADSEGLTRIIESVHSTYSSLMASVETKIRTNQLIIPIGLPSSGVIANWHLNALDESILSRVNPEYYGRYVDDLLMVISDFGLKKSAAESVDALLERYFVDTKILRTKEDPGKSESEKITYDILPEEYASSLQLQTEKIATFYFDAGQPTSILDKFKAEIKKSSSEFNYLPEDDDADKDFNEAACSIAYGGTTNKIRSIKEIRADKYEISKYLAKKIYISLQTEVDVNDVDEKAEEQILGFFKGQRCLENLNQWEKVATYFVIHNQKKNLITFLKNALESINSVKIENELDIKTANNLKDYLSIALHLAIALRPSIYWEGIAKTNIPGNLQFFLDRDQVQRNVRLYRSSNLIRHAYVSYPILNYTNISLEKNIDLIDQRISYDQSIYTHPVSSRQKDLNESQINLSPRYVHFHEVALYIIYTKILKSLKKNGEAAYAEFDLFNGYAWLNEAFKVFYRLNYARKGLGVHPSQREAYKRMKREIFDVHGALRRAGEPADAQFPLIKTIRITASEKEQLDALKVALANMKIDETDIESSYLKKPNLKNERRLKLGKLFNASRKERADMLVMPETAVPYRWLKWICDHAKKNKLAAVFGLEHWVVSNVAYNFIVTLLPARIRNVDCLIPVVRLKNHYAPKEEHILRGHGYDIPKAANAYYDLFKWRGLSFSVFNCYELADIKHRAIFRSKVDFLIACEYNEDVSYFSSIVESASRDLHCYFIQLNNAKYGDSRITQPSKTEVRDIIKIKGGINSTVLVDTINIKSLRDFQRKEYRLQHESGEFKPTPPDFSRDRVRA